MTERTRFVTLWRKPAAPIDWDFYISEDEREVRHVIRNLREQKVRDAATYELGPQRSELSIKDAMP